MANEMRKLAEMLLLLLLLVGKTLSKRSWNKEEMSSFRVMMFMCSHYYIGKD
jgi:hypothetical protein